MLMRTPRRVSLAGFEAKYHDAAHALRYREKRRRSWSGRLSDAFEQRLCRRALAVAGKVPWILDCPGGTGRFWSSLHAFCDHLVAADQSGQMLRAGLTVAEDQRPLGAFVGRAESLPMKDDSVDLVFSSRLVHHIGDPAERVAILASFARVSRRWVVFSTWETGNRTHRRHARRDAERPRPTNRFFVDLKDVIAEVEQAGLTVRRVLRKMRGVSPLVFLVCELGDV